MKKRNSSFLYTCWKTSHKSHLVERWACIHVYLYVQKSASCRFEKKTGWFVRSLDRSDTLLCIRQTPSWFRTEFELWPPFFHLYILLQPQTLGLRHQTHSGIHVLCGQHFLGSQDKILLYFPHNRSGCLDRNVGFRSTYLGQMEFNISRKNTPCEVETKVVYGIFCSL